MSECPTGGSSFEPLPKKVMKVYCCEKCRKKAEKIRARKKSNHSKKVERIEVDRTRALSLVVGWCCICGAGITGKHAVLKKTCSKVCRRVSETNRNRERRLRNKDEYNARQVERYREKRAAFLLENKEQIAQRDAERKIRNKETQRIAAIRWKKENIGKVRDWGKAKQRRSRSSFSDGYIADLLIQKTGLKRNQIPQGLIKVKREQLKIIKLLKEMS